MDRTSCEQKKAERCANLSPMRETGSAIEVSKTFQKFGVLRRASWGRDTCSLVAPTCERHDVQLLWKSGLAGTQQF